MIKFMLSWNELTISKNTVIIASFYPYFFLNSMMIGPSKCLNIYKPEKPAVF